MNAVAKIDIASVTQNIAIIKETAAALIAIVSIPLGGGNNIRVRNTPIPTIRPIFSLLLTVYSPNKYLHADGALL